MKRTRVYANIVMTLVIVWLLIPLIATIIYSLFETWTGVVPKGFTLSAYKSIFTNAGYMAIPILTALLGPESTIYASVYVVCFNILVWTVGWIIAVFMPRPAVSLFTSDPALRDMAVRGLRIMTLVGPIIGFQMVTTNLFQCLGMVNKSIFLSLTRQLIFLLPCIYFLPVLTGDETGVWYSFPISDFLASLTTAIFAVGLLRKLGRLRDGDDPAILGSKI